MSLRRAAIRRVLYHLAVRGLLLAFLARALIPAGFMPDAEAAARGVVQLTHCNEHATSAQTVSRTAASLADPPAPRSVPPHPLTESEGTVQGSSAAAGGHVQPGQNPNGHRLVPCEFAALASYFHTPSASNFQVAVVYVLDRTASWSLHTPAIPISRTAGPVLGSRGPPQRLS